MTGTALHVPETSIIDDDGLKRAQAKLERLRILRDMNLRNPPHRREPDIIQGIRAQQIEDLTVAIAAYDPQDQDESESDWSHHH